MKKLICAALVAIPLAASAAHATTAPTPPIVKVVCPFTLWGGVACVATGAVIIDVVKGKNPVSKEGTVPKAAKEMRNWIGHRTGLQKIFSW